MTNPIEAFWADARVRAKLNRLEGYLGASVEASFPPPAWSFGDDRQMADRLMGLVLAGRKTATSSALRDYEEDARQRAEEGSEDHDAGVDGDVGGDVLVRTDVDLMLPESGMLNILLDGSGLPRALIRLTDVQVVRFADVTAEHAHREGEGDRSLNHWRREHRHFFERSSAVGEPVDDDTMVVLESFEVLVPPEARRAARKDRG